MRGSPPYVSSTGAAAALRLISFCPSIEEMLSLLGGDEIAPVSVTIKKKTRRNKTTDCSNTKKALTSEKQHIREL